METEQFKVLICGSRDWPPARVAEISERVGQLPDDAIVIAGGARGVDKIAENAARGRGLEVEVFPADWVAHGKRAGYLRNVQMLNQKPDLVIAFHAAGSRGTLHTINEARTRNIKLEIHRA